MIAVGNPQLWQSRYPEPPEPPVSRVLDLWRLQFDTSQIARMLGVRESIIYNMLARLTK